MEEQNAKIRKYSLISGILFLIYGVISVSFFVYWTIQSSAYDHFFFSFWDVRSFISCALPILAAAACFSKKDILAIVYAGIDVAVDLLGLILSFNVFDLILFIASAIFLMLTLFGCVDSMKSQVSLHKALCFVPGIVLCVYIAIILIGNLAAYWTAHLSLANLILYISATVFWGLWMYEKNACFDRASYNKNVRGVNCRTGSVPENEGYMSLGVHVVLCLFTFGIWGFIWIYRTTKLLNKAPNCEQYNPTNKLLLCIFVPFYAIYWIYRHGQKLDAYSESVGIKDSNMTTMCLILGIFVPVVAIILMQDRINNIIKKQSMPDSENQKTNQAAGNATSTETESARIKNLREYKQLYDDGIITQEEFDAKKEKILGL